MPIAEASYTSYLLRLWCAQQEDGHTWIACVQSTATGERRWFPNLEALVQFLRDEFGGATPVLHVDLEARPKEKDKKVAKKVVKFHVTIKNLW